MDANEAGVGRAERCARRHPAGVVVFGLVLFALVAMGHGCGAGDGPAVPEDAIRVNLYKWVVDASQLSARAGWVTFDVRHYHPPGPHTHEEGEVHHLAIARKEADGTFNVVARTRDLEENERQLVAVRLEPGEYELQCLVTEVVRGEPVSHYAMGMRVDFTVH